MLLTVSPDNIAHPDCLVQSTRSTSSCSDVTNHDPNWPSSKATSSTVAATNPSKLSPAQVTDAFVASANKRHLMPKETMSYSPIPLSAPPNRVRNFDDWSAFCPYYDEKSQPVPRRSYLSDKIATPYTSSPSFYS